MGGRNKVDAGVVWYGKLVIPNFDDNRIRKKIRGQPKTPFCPRTNDESGFNQKFVLPVG